MSEAIEKHSSSTTSGSLQENKPGVVRAIRSWIHSFSYFPCRLDESSSWSWFFTSVFLSFLFLLLGSFSTFASFPHPMFGPPISFGTCFRWISLKRALINPHSSSKGSTSSNTQEEDLCQTVIERTEPALQWSIYRTEGMKVETLISNIPPFRIPVSSDLLGFTSVIREGSLTVLWLLMLISNALGRKRH